MLSCFIGGVFAIVLYQVYMNNKYKKTLKELDAQIEKVCKKPEANTPAFKKGDFLKMKDVAPQPWEKEPRPQVYGEVLDVGDGEYLLSLSMAGYAESRQPIAFVEAHAAFIKDVSKKQKPVFKLVKEESV